MPDKPTQQDREEGVSFLKKFCKKRHRFNGGDVLEAWRETKHPSSLKDWRNVFSSVLAHGVESGWMIIVDRAKPTSKQSHTRSLSVYESRLAKKPLGYKPAPTASRFIDEQVGLLRTGKINAHELAWRVYGYGVENKPCS